MVLALRATGLLYFVLPTSQCNLQCSYCGGSFPIEKVGEKAQYDPKELGELIAGDADATIAFYGGEPLLNAPFVERVMDAVPAKRFVMQTNGLLFRALPPRYWNRMDTVLLSVDGREDLTDRCRGMGVYSSVTKAARELRVMGYGGDLVARMAVSEGSDIFEEVLHLYGTKLFDHMHWQLDAGWSDSWTDFDGWAERSYKPGIRRLMDFWKSSLKEGEVVGLVPFLGILKRLREGGPSPPCGSGSVSYSVLPDGKIIACPVAYDAPWAVVGNLGKLKRPLRRVGVLGDCLGCDLLGVCGGRCLYFNREGFWGKEGFKKVCEVTRFIIGVISEAKEESESMLRRRGMPLDLLEYPKFNNSTEIIP